MKPQQAGCYEEANLNGWISYKVSKDRSKILELWQVPVIKTVLMQGDILEHRSTDWRPYKSTIG